MRTLLLTIALLGCATEASEIACVSGALSDDMGVPMNTYLVTPGSATSLIPVGPAFARVYALPAMANGPLIERFYSVDTLFTLEELLPQSVRIISGKRGSDLQADDSLIVTPDTQFARFRNHTDAPLEITIFGECAQ